LLRLDVNNDSLVYNKGNEIWKNFIKGLFNSNILLDRKYLTYLNWFLFINLKVVVKKMILIK
jgi:hypothetical protein